MSGPEILIPIAVVVLVFGLKGFREVKDYLLKREQIKADASIKAEALRLKNEIELEKLIQNDQRDKGNQNNAGNEDAPSTERKSNDRLRY